MGLSFLDNLSTSRDIKVFDWFRSCGHGLLNQPVEQFSPMHGCPPVEPESELVKVSRKVHRGDCPLVSSK